MNNRKQKITHEISLVLSHGNENESDFIPLLEGDNEPVETENFPDELPILPLRNAVLFPGVVIPISVAREKSLKLLKEANAGNRLIGAVAQIDIMMEEPEVKDLYKVGTVAKILKILEMPDGSKSVIIQGQSRFTIEKQLAHEPFIRAAVSVLPEQNEIKDVSKFDALVASIKDEATEIIRLSSSIPEEAAFALKNIDSSVFLINFIASNSEFDIPNKQTLLEINDIEERGLKMLEFMAIEVNKLRLKDDIQSKVKFELDQQQREYFLNQQIKTIRNELGGDPVDHEIEELQNKVEGKKWSKTVADTYEKELKKLERINPASPDYSNQVNYLQMLAELPWGEYTTDNFDIKNAAHVLDAEHFGLDKVKDRILEHLAVLKLKGDMKSPILCLYGPPGVGKTSLGKSVAEALNRKYIRMSLGGLHDEAEIRGHRKTYIGAMPGRIIQNIKKANSSNPVFILDEIDKVGNDFRGDPSSALLEVLDPEQNATFYDNYLELEFDLSKVMFIATANHVSSIHPALRDRMEMIEVSGYLLEEKIEIAKKHLIPKLLENHGLKKAQIVFSNEVLEYVIENHTRESGVRSMEKKLAAVVRNFAKRVALEEKVGKTVKIADVKRILGSPEVFKDKYSDDKLPGVATGLAWTEAGGEILYVETAISKGSGNLSLTGNLGNVMKESAQLAIEYIKSKADKLNLPDEVLQKYNIHVHVPEGAIPKDGPSAGITMISSMVSALTGKRVRSDIAMTGEITLRGKVLPVGGIKEKILAAKRAGIKEVVMSRFNKQDVEQIKTEYLGEMKFRYIDSIDELLEYVIVND